jgi:hypothetical protein
LGGPGTAVRVPEDELEELPPGVDTPLLFPASEAVT